MEEKKKDFSEARNPEETEQEVSNLAAKMEEMENAEGVFGEVMSDEELDEVAGGGITYPDARTNVMCPICQNYFFGYEGDVCSPTCADRRDGKIDRYGRTLEERQERARKLAEYHARSARNRNP